MTKNASGAAHGHQAESRRRRHRRRRPDRHVLAKELADSGLKLVGLERGGWRDTHSDFDMPHAHDDLRYVRRRELVERLRKRIPDDFGFILQQRRIFSYSGLSREQMIAMRERYSVYGIESGRICVAALNSHNLDYVADAIASTVRFAGDGALASSSRAA
jgi:hypothetical protein